MKAPRLLRNLGTKISVPKLYLRFLKQKPPIRIVLRVLLSACDP